VTPLTEDCGILEWVPKTGTLRTAVQGIYEQEGHFDRKTNGVIDSMYKHHEHKYQVCAAARPSVHPPSEDAGVQPTSQLVSVQGEATACMYTKPAADASAIEPSQCLLPTDDNRKLGKSRAGQHHPTAQVKRAVAALLVA
jgi:hypothetical protein